MKFTERYQQSTGTVDPGAPQPIRGGRSIEDIKRDLHGKVIDRLDVALIQTLSRDQLRGQLRQAVEQLVTVEGLPLNQAEKEKIVVSILDDILGLGPLEVLLADSEVSDVLVNTHKQVYVEKKGKLQLTAVRFRDDRHLLNTINRIVSRIGRRIDESSPMVDARLPDGSRVNAIIPPLAIDGPILSIRRFGSVPLRHNDLVRNNSVSAAMITFLHAAVQARCNILISGGTGSGKTTLLNILSSFIPNDDRIVTIEDSAELKLQQEHVVRLESRPPNIEGKGAVSIHDLVKNSLRMRPDRIVIGEIRSVEVLDMLQAMNTGHEGSMATIHANTASDAISRLTTMIAMAGTKLGEESMIQIIGRALHVIVQLNRMSDGARRVTSISELVGFEGNRVHMQDVFAFEQSGFDGQGRIVGSYVNRYPSVQGARFRKYGVNPGIPVRQ
ncbi:MAG: CpaF family protein [Deltaproteobacteria bacterium]|nr:CpaF family protein [Deltaproteobacteria bacterium]